MHEYLSIGELASIFNITVQLLRHYDAKGLLVPSIRDSETGHRKYHFDQMYMLATIRYLRKLGYSLNSIKQFLVIDNFEKAIDTMQEQSEILRQKYQELLLTDNIIQKKLAFTLQERENIVENKVVYKHLPSRQFALIGAETALFTHELFYFYPTIGFYKGEEKKFGAYMIDSPDVISISVWNSHMNRSMLASGKYACYYHFGPYEKIYESIEKLRAHLGDVDCPRDDTVITINICDQFITSDQEKYVTELQILVE